MDDDKGSIPATIEQTMSGNHAENDDTEGWEENALYGTTSDDKDSARSANGLGDREEAAAMENDKEG